MTAHASEAAVEAGIAGVLAAHWDYGPSTPFGRWECKCGAPVGDEDGVTDEAMFTHVAAALLASPEFAGMVAAAKAGALREAAEALNVEGLSFKPGGWGSNPTDQQTIDVMVKAVHWLRDRAASHEADQ